MRLVEEANREVEEANREVEALSASLREVAWRGND
jgi:hypothetical protein